jgi:octaprenyl-diphosphate synthase
VSVTASASQTGPDSADRRPSFDALRALVADDLVKVNETIIREMHSPVALIPQLAGHIVASGGKRLRPMLTLAAAGLVGYEGSRHIDLAACVEFIHTATLLHDDVVDESNLRRGKDTANAVWGNQASVLVGDFLFSRAFQLMVADGSLKVLKILSDASAVIAEGEVHQLVTTNDIETTEAAYLQVIESKTAVLFAAASQIGAVVAERPESEEKALESFGRNLGVAFQLVDDVLDYSAQQEALGKTVGDDFREGKMTLPVILAYAAGDAEERAFWRRTVGDMEQTKADLAHAQALMTKHGTLAKTLNRARDYAEAAHRDLDLFAPTAHRRAMEEVIDFCVDRAY